MKISKKNSFREKVISVVSKIPRGGYLTYREAAKKAGNASAYRTVGNILAGNKDSKVPCYRVVRSDHTIGGYKGRDDLAWEKLAFLLKDGAVAVMPTDTIYGICSSVFVKDAVLRIYKLRKRDLEKPMIVLVSDFNDLALLGINPTKKEMKVLEKIWPGKVSAVLRVRNKAMAEKLDYLHRGRNTLAVRMPRDNFLRNVLRISGPIVAPSANWEGKEPSETIAEAREYFGNRVLYYNGGRIRGEPSTLVRVKGEEVEILRGEGGIRD